MKKLLVLLLVLVLGVSFVGCQSKDEEEGSNKVELNMTLEEIIDEIYTQSGLELPGTMKTELSKENMVYMLGVDNFEFIEGFASEPMMSSQAHSVVLFTVDDSVDVEAIKKDIKENVDGRKWICVEVAEENILVDHVGQYVILIMDEQSQVLMDTFHDIVK